MEDLEPHLPGACLHLYSSTPYVAWKNTPTVGHFTSKHGLSLQCSPARMVISPNIYQNAKFQRDNPRLLENIWRRGCQRSPAQEEPCCKRRKLFCPRRCPHLQKKKQEKTISLKEAPNKQAPQGQGTFLPAGVTGCPLALCPPEEHSVPCGECPPEDGNMVSPAGDRMEGSGQVSIRPSWYPDWGSVMSFYNKCSSMLKAALAAISLSELPDGEREHGSTSVSSAEEEQEGFRQNKCVICVLYKYSSRS